MARQFVQESDHPQFNFHSLASNGKTFLEAIDTNWIRRFKETRNIVTCTQCGKFSVSPEKQEMIDKSVAINLEKLRDGFESGFTMRGMRRILMRLNFRST